MENIWITVYKDTINHQYNGDDNLSCILVPEEIFKSYYYENIWDNLTYPDYETFKKLYICDDIDDFYKYALDHGGVIAIEDF